MPLSLADFKRPPQDNGRGLVGYPGPGWMGGEQGLDYWIAELQQLGIKWFRVCDDNGDSLVLCQKLVQAGIFPIVRILRRDLPPNDSPEPNPGHISAREEITIKKLIDVGVLYFETNNEPDNPAEWKHHAIPANLEEAAKLVALNWLFDARFILEAGGYPGLPAVSSGNGMDLIGALASLGRHDILLEGCWIAIHNFGHNRPLNFPADRVTQTGAALSPHEYDFGPLTEWVWWDNALGRANTLDEINQLRARKKNAGQAIGSDHAAFRAYEYYDALARKYLGRSIPILSTEGGYQVGRRMDLRYPRITPALQADLMVALYDFMQRNAPEYYFACCASLMIPSPRTESDAWYSDFWDRTLRAGNPTNPEFPPIAVPAYRVGAPLPVVAAVKAMPNVPRVKPSAVGSRPSAVGHTAPPPPPPPPPPLREENIYLVQHGDTLASIAKKFRVTVSAIAAANSIAPDGRVMAGQRLVIPDAPSSQELTRLIGQGGDGVSPSHAAGSQTHASAPTPPAPPPPPGTATALAHALRPPPPPRPPWSMALDPRLIALNVRVEPAKVRPGETYWKLVRAEYQDPQQAGGNHHIIYSLLDQKGKPVLVQRVFQGLAGIQADSFTDAFGRAKIPMWESYRPEEGESGPYSAWVAGYPSDKVVGLGMPNGMAVSFILTWQKSVK